MIIHLHFIFYYLLFLIIQLTLLLASCKALTGKETVPFVRLSKTARNCSDRRDAFRWTAIHLAHLNITSPLADHPPTRFTVVRTHCATWANIVSSERGVVRDVRILQAGARPLPTVAGRCAVRTAAGDHNRALHVGLLLSVVFSDLKFVRIT